MSSIQFDPIAYLAAALLVAGCGERDSVPARDHAAGRSAAVPAPVSDQWMGKWIGPEGTFLLIAGNTGQYELTIQDLDGARTFAGTAVVDGIEFERDGVTEVVRATDGAGTGMKWLNDRKDCLSVHPGEGYCRD